ncbi:hypothetical protein ACJX0J_034201, partial [Zea mays]
MAFLVLQLYTICARLLITKIVKEYAAVFFSCGIFTRRFLCAMQILLYRICLYTIQITEFPRFFHRAIDESIVVNKLDLTLHFNNILIIILLVNFRGWMIASSCMGEAHAVACLNVYTWKLFSLIHYLIRPTLALNECQILSLTDSVVCLMSELPLASQLSLAVFDWYRFTMTNIVSVYANMEQNSICFCGGDDITMFEHLYTLLKFTSSDVNSSHLLYEIIV